MCARNLMTLLLLFCSILISIEGTEDAKGESYLYDLTKDEYTAFIKQPGVRIVYFYKKELTRIKYFYGEYETSAQLLDSYNVRFGKVDCAKEVIPDFCSRKRYEGNVYTFRDGHELLELSLDSMFDVNSIVSNVLQIVLLREVPILQTKAERVEHEDRLKGDDNLIFSYQKAIGTYEHRILMEVAFAYQGKYKFALTTEKPTVQELPDFDTFEDVGIWYLQCKTAKMGEPCKASKYKDNIDLASLARFVKALDIPPVHDFNLNGGFNPYDGLDMHTVYVYYDDESAQQVKKESVKLAEAFLGILGIMMINVNHADATAYGFDERKKVPALAIKMRAQKYYEFMPVDKQPVPFINQRLARSMQGMKNVNQNPHLYKDSPFTKTDTDDSSSSKGADVHENDFHIGEEEDDELAAALYKLRRAKVDRQFIQTLTDKTFPAATGDSDFLVVLFYLVFDSRSMAFMRSYVEASKLLDSESQRPLAAIDCFDWTDVCKKTNITSYPTIRFYRKGREEKAYRGMLGTAPFIAAVKMFQVDTPVVLESIEDAGAFMDGTLPADIGTVTNVSVLGIFKREHEKEIDSFKEASSRLEGKILFGLSVGVEAIADQYSDGSLPAVLIHKRHDRYQPDVIHHGKMTSTQIIQLVLQAALPIFPELTPANFPPYKQMKKPFVILFSSERDTPEHELIGSLALSRKLGDKVVCWMDVSDPKGVNSEILSEYMEKATLPALVLVNIELAVLHIFSSEEMTDQVIIKWVKGIESGKVPPSKHLKKGEWLPKHPGYDFLRLVDRDDKRALSVEAESTGHSRVRQQANEHGLGMDGDDDMDTDPDTQNEDSEADTEAENEIRDELKNLRHSRIFHTNKEEKRQQQQQHEAHTEL